MKTLQRAAWILVVIVDAGFVVWGGMAALFLNQLAGPHGAPILAAGYQGFTGATWTDLAATSPMTAKYIGMLFRLYGVYNVAFGLTAAAIAATAFRRGERWAWWTLLAGNTLALLSAMTYDWTVNAIGPFEVSEYLGVIMVWSALAVTAPFRYSASAKSSAWSHAS